MTSQDTITMLLVGFWLFFPIGFILLLLHQVFTEDDEVVRDFSRLEHDLDDVDNVISLKDHREKKEENKQSQGEKEKDAA